MFSLPFFYRSSATIGLASTALLFNVSLSALHQSIELGGTGYHFHREREGGVHQSGGLYGLEGEWWGCCNWGPWWSLRGRWASGQLNGKNGSGSRLRSTLCDAEGCALLGWRICAKICGGKLAITPYGGYGEHKGRNRFVSPSPLQVTFVDRYGMGLCGLRTECSWNPNLCFGIEGSMKWIIEGKRRIEGDTVFGDLEQMMGKGKCWEVLADCAFRPTFTPIVLKAQLSVRMREYGENQNYPFDFKKSRQKMIGGSLRAVWRL